MQANNLIEDLWRTITSAEFIIDIIKSSISALVAGFVLLIIGYWFIDNKFQKYQQKRDIEIIRDQFLDDLTDILKNANIIHLQLHNLVLESLPSDTENKISSEIRKSLENLMRDYFNFEVKYKARFKVSEEELEKLKGVSVILANSTLGFYSENKRDHYTKLLSGLTITLTILNNIHQKILKKDIIN